MREVNQQNNGRYDSTRKHTPHCETVQARYPGEPCVCEVPQAAPYVVTLATPAEQAAYVAKKRASGDDVYLRRLDDQTLTEAINNRKGRLGNVADYQCELALYQDEANRRATK